MRAVCVVSNNVFSIYINNEIPKEYIQSLNSEPHTDEKKYAKIYFATSPIGGKISFTFLVFV